MYSSYCINNYAVMCAQLSVDTCCARACTGRGVVGLAWYPTAMAQRGNRALVLQLSVSVARLVWQPAVLLKCTALLGDLLLPRKSHAARQLADALLFLVLDLVLPPDCDRYSPMKTWTAVPPAACWAGVLPLSAFAVASAPLSSSRRATSRVCAVCSGVKPPDR